MTLRAVLLTQVISVYTCCGDSQAPDWQKTTSAKSQSYIGLAQSHWIWSEIVQYRSLVASVNIFSSVNQTMLSSHGSSLHTGDFIFIFIHQNGAQTFHKVVYSDVFKEGWDLPWSVLYKFTGLDWWSKNFENRSARGKSVVAPFPDTVYTYRVKWRHISVVAMRSPFCRSTRRTMCAVKWWRFVVLFESNWISWFKKMSVLSLSYWESDVYCRQNNKHFAELAPQNGKQLIWRNYVTVTLCIYL